MAFSLCLSLSLHLSLSLTLFPLPPSPPVRYPTWQPEFIGQRIEVPTSGSPTSGQYGCTHAVAQCYVGGTKDKLGTLDPGKVTQATPGNLTIEVMSLQVSSSQ